MDFAARVDDYNGLKWFYPIGGGKGGNRQIVVEPIAEASRQIFICALGKALRCVFHVVFCLFLGQRRAAL
jgi:hypothetical protein